MSLYSATTAICSAAPIRTVTAAMVALAVVMSTSPTVRAADERPDLKIELIGLPLSATARDVQVRVSNVSVWWATGSKLSVQTVSPAAGNLKQLDVGNLDPGQSVTLSYALAAACNGDVVKANVAGAKNYAGVAESQLNNNELQSEVCKAQTPTKPAAATAARVTDVVSLKPPAITAQAADPASKPGDVSAAVIGRRSIRTRPRRRRAPDTQKHQRPGGRHPANWPPGPPKHHGQGSRHHHNQRGRRHAWRDWYQRCERDKRLRSGVRPGRPRWRARDCAVPGGQKGPGWRRWLNALP
jgi:hypothetical protein